MRDLQLYDIACAVPSGLYKIPFNYQLNSYGAPARKGSHARATRPQGKGERLLPRPRACSIFFQSCRVKSAMRFHSVLGACGMQGVGSAGWRRRRSWVQSHFFPADVQAIGRRRRHSSAPAGRKVVGLRCSAGSAHNAGMKMKRSDIIREAACLLRGRAGRAC